MTVTVKKNKKSKETYFYEYSQNNSGGFFDVDDKVCHRVVIEAHSTNEANNIAESIGIYFYGVAKFKDCGCCGDRWYDPFDDDYISDETLQLYNESWTVKENLIDYFQFLANEYGSTDPDCRIFYLNGDIVEIYKDKKKKKVK